ncbi:MAG: SH3 domain-containing protein [Gammaproteobacteria bacterium]|nr:SH3 domain-containing protein [Gammaproteobacteria bacterium]
MACDLYCRCTPRRGLRAALPLLTWLLSGCALLQPPAPPPAAVDCTRQDREIVQLQQVLTEKDTEIQRLRAQQNVQAKELKQTTGEVARAEVKLRRLATQADAASQLAEVEVALQGVQSGAHPRRALAQLAQAQLILDAGAASFAQGDYGAAVELAAQSQEIVDMVASGHRRSTPDARDAVEVPFQVPVALRTRVDSHLRAHPGRTASALGVLRQGTALQAHAYRGEWLRVRTEDGRAGWVFGTLLEPPLPAAE